MPTPIERSGSALSLFKQIAGTLLFDNAKNITESGLVLDWKDNMLS